MRLWELTNAVTGMKCSKRKMDVKTFLPTVAQCTLFQNFFKKSRETLLMYQTHGCPKHSFQKYLSGYFLQQIYINPSQVDKLN